MEQSPTPRISVIVIAHNMAEQLANTLYTLNQHYQMEGSSLDYEVLILENDSDNTLDHSLVQQLPEYMHYTLRKETSQSPAAAINQGIAQAKGDVICLMIDGAHMLSPGVMKYANMAFAISTNAFVTVPAYHLGPEEQHLSSTKGYNQAQETELLKSLNWQEEGYQLFSVAANCEANPRGYFAPIMESNCFFASKQAFVAIGGADTDFQLPGGGSLNLHMTRLLGTQQNSPFFTLAGEGSFHQFHGGVTSDKQRQHVVDQHRQQLHQKWQGKFDFLARNPIILGQFQQTAHPQLRQSSERMQRRFQICQKQQQAVWPDDHSVTDD